jgi:rRNA maturation endonuclease Nob1
MAYEDILGIRKEEIKKTISVMVRCDHCNKAFNAPINGSHVKICPWCTHKNRMFKGESPKK